MGVGARAPLPVALRGPAYRAFARATGADLAEAELAPREYASLGELFTRRLRPGARPIDGDPRAVISPCDGALAARGTTEDGTLVQAKGRTYTLAELVVDEERAERLRGGAYATFYLSPRDYHRVHAPFDGKLVGYDYVPGQLWPVNPKVASRRDRLFARNERVVIWLELGRAGLACVVMVGASGVGNIRLAHGDDSANVSRGAHRELRRVELPAIPVARGDELGAFQLGSTVVVAMQPGALTGEFTGEIGGAVRLGERVGGLA